MKHQRGQTLIETAIFLPLVLLSLTAIIYFSQYGVLQGRAVQAVRYATLVTNGGSAATQPSSIYTIESMYNELAREGAGAAGGTSDPGYPVSGGTWSFACGGAGTTAGLALYQKESMPSGLSAPTPAPTFFQADATPSASCVAQKLYLPNGNQENAASYLMAQYTSVSAMKNSPGFLQAMNVTAPQQISAGMTYTLPAAPAPVVYCSQTFALTMAESLGLGPMTTPNVESSPYGNYPNPGSTPTARPNC